MNEQELHPLARDYVRQLRKAAAGLPRDHRSELIDQIEAHLAEAAPARSSDVDVRTTLDRLGDPVDIVAEAAPSAPELSGRTREWFAIILLVTGFPPILGWLVGLGLLFGSAAWTSRDKVIGALIAPGGWIAALLLGGIGSNGQICSGTVNGPTHCSGGGGTNWLLAAAFAFWLVGPLANGVYLAVRMRR